MTAFPTAGHLVSRARFTPIDKQSAGRAKTASTGKCNPWLAGALGEIVAGLARTDTFLSDRYRRLARRRGKKRAVPGLCADPLRVTRAADQSGLPLPAMVAAVTSATTSTTPLP
jgi:transposase